MKNLLIYLFLIVMILISITFLTLMEQKVLSYVQIRKGPNKVGFLGMIQPFSDALKLFFKEFSFPIYSNYLSFYLSPVFSLMLSLMIWISFPFLFYTFSFNLMFLYMFSCMSVGVYFIMISGWSSNSNYSLLGSLRSIAQTISYEVCMIFFFLSFFIFVLSMNIFLFFNYQQFISFFFLNFLICLVLFIIFLVETNRSPFDFSEGESELVSGFNIEYSSGGFALIFLSEYSMIMFLSMIYCYLFFFNYYFYYLLFMKIMFFSFLYILIRSAFPRFRYDKLMYLTWKLYLSISLFNLMIFLNFKFIIYIYLMI